MATAGELISIIRTDYLDDNPEVAVGTPAGDIPYLWKDAFLYRALSEAQKQACKRMHLIYDDTSAATSITLVNNTHTYTLDASITKVEAVRFNGKAVVHKSRTELDEQDPEWRTYQGMIDNECRYAVRGHKIRFSPYPDATDAALPVTLEVFRLPTAVLDDAADVPEIDVQYHFPLIYWVLYEAYRKADADTRDLELSQLYLGQFVEVFGPEISAEVRLHVLESPKTLRLYPRPRLAQMFVEADDGW